MLTCDIGYLLKKPVGTRQSFNIDEKVHLDDSDDLVLTENVTGRVQLIKLPHEISVSLNNLHTIAESRCSRCIRRFSCPIDIESAEREFIIDLPERDLTKDEDIFYINKKTNQIELDDMIRDEILLHFPPIPVCSESCKGLCDKCGSDLNDKECTCSNV